MSNKKRNVITLVVLIIALLSFAIIKFTGNQSSNFKSHLAIFDESTVSNVEINSPKFASVLKLEKSSDKWIINGGKGFAANNQKIESLLKEINGTKIKAVVATKKTSQKKYNTSDSLGTKIKIYKGKNLLSSIIVGKFDYRQDKQNPTMSNGRPNGEPITYISLPNEVNVYSISSMLPLQLGQSIDDYRDKSILKLDKSLVDKLKFSTKTGGEFQLNRMEDKWMIDNQIVDSALVAGYLNKIATINGRDFVKENTDNMVSDNELTIYQKEGDAISVISNNKDSTSSIVNSSQFQENFFIDKNNIITRKLFVEKDYFLKK